MPIKRKYCAAHGWAPHKEVEGWWFCCRCYPSNALTFSKRILAKLRGFRLHESTTARAYLTSLLKLGEVL